MIPPEPAEAETLLDRHAFRPLSKIVSSAARESSLSARGMRWIALVVGLSGASLLRYRFATEFVAGALLVVIYAVLDRAAVELARVRPSRVGRVAAGAGHVLVGLVSLFAVADHVAAEGHSALWVVLGFGSAALQAVIADHFVRHDLARATPGAPVDELAETEAEIERGKADAAVLLLRVYAVFLRVQRALGRYREQGAQSPEAAAAHARALGPVAAGWAWLGHSTHVVLLAVLVCYGSPSVYGWIRLTLGNLALFGLYAAQRSRERALDPPGPVAPEAVAPPVAAAIDGAPLAPPAAEPPPAEKHGPAPISWRPPPLDE